MIRILVLYPRSEGSTFDADYYVSTHMPLVKSTWGDAVTGWAVDMGVADQPHHCVGHVTFTSMDAFGAAMGGPGAATVMGDIPNFTNVQPQVFVSEVTATS